MQRLQIAGALVLLALATGCGATLKHEVEVKPVYITVDLNVKVQKELNNVFDFEDELEKKADQVKGK